MSAHETDRFGERQDRSRSRGFKLAAKHRQRVSLERLEDRTLMRPSLVTDHLVAIPIAARVAPHAAQRHAATGSKAVLVPGVPGQSVEATFTLDERDAVYRNAVGLFRVDNVNGRIGKLLPGQRGYAKAALSRRLVLFEPGQDAAAVAHAELVGGALFGSYLVQNGTSDQVLASRAGHRPRVFFSFAAANSDHTVHVRRPSADILAFEDQWRGGDRDFNDAVIRMTFGSPPDTHAPAVTIATPASGLVTNHEVVVSGRAIDDLSGVESVEAQVVKAGTVQAAGVSSDLTSVPFDSDTGTFSFPAITTGDGVYNVRVRGTDWAGNISKFTTTSFTLDTTAPAISVILDPGSDTAPLGDRQTTLASITLSGHTEPDLGVTLEGTNRTTKADDSGRFTFTGVSLAIGSNPFTVQTQDAAGNQGSSTTNVVRLVVDSAPPIVSAMLAHDTAPGGTTNADRVTADPTVSGTIVDTGSINRFTAGLDGATPDRFLDVLSTLRADGTFTLDQTHLDQIAGGQIADGPHVLHLSAQDDSGNASTIFDLAFTLDRQGPIVTVVSPLADQAVSGDLNISGTAVDSLSGVSRLQARIDSGTLIDVSVVLRAGSCFRQLWRPMGRPTDRIP